MEPSPSSITIDKETLGASNDLNILGQNVYLLTTTGGIISINSNSGSVKLQNLTYPPTDGNSGQLLTTNGLGTLSWITPTSNIITIDRTVLTTDTTIQSGSISGIYGIRNYSSPVGITLPTSATFSSGAKRFIIVDEGGTAAVQNITIYPNGSDKIIGQDSFIINGAYNSVSLYPDGVSSWFVG